MKTIAIRIVALLALLAPALLLPTAAQAHPRPYCGITWGSLPKSSTAMSVPGPDLGTITNVRTGRHSCFDRFVIDVNGSTNGYQVAYTDQIYAEGSGHVVPTSGGAILGIIVEAAAHDDNGVPTFSPADPANVSGYRTFRDVTWSGTFEGQSAFCLGVRARLPFRVFNLTGPGDGSRVVVDVAHRW